METIEISEETADEAKKALNYRVSKLEDKLRYVSEDSEKEREIIGKYAMANGALDAINEELAYLEHERHEAEQ